ncbi:conserved hypothetical protein [Methanocaldococcus vulcanius M7]|uniref:Uncharacterized protein n=1 Tax=Methanocaldococcus vulcanius (strain ATCC 700851 / DSM 12094 / M7) TaxID=579137 RepID=C9RF67_METVM|nr:hypothetical protein [Methanocaldococcus vulcanius]ACX72219.1 conserved hypothetical protein [Methanocaldococcus vulcanius M7]
MESYYDTIPNFRYWDVNAWRKYVQEYIVPMYETTKCLLDFKNELSFYVGMSLENVNQSNNYLMPFFIGGIDEEGNYKENALAKLIYLMFGIYVDAKEFVNTMELTGEEGLKDIKVESKDMDNWPFIKFLEKINKHSLEIIKKLNIDVQPSIKVEDILKNPDKILDVLKELYKACVSFNASYNYYTFFILSSYGIHFRYLISAYPKLNEHFEEIKEFLGFCPMFVPDVDNSTIKKYYTILRYEKDSIGDNLFKMQLHLWNSFEKSEIHEVFKYIVEKPENLKEKYKELAKKSIGEEFKEINIGDECIHLYEDYFLIVNGVYVNSISRSSYDEYCQARENWMNGMIHWSELEFYKRPIKRSLQIKIYLFDFLDKIAPVLFLKLATILPSKVGKFDNYYLTHLKDIINDVPNLIYYGNFLEDYPSLKLGRLE